MAKPLSFAASSDDHDLIVKIVDRASLMQPEGMQQSRMDWHMDITVCHANGCPLKLEELLAAPDCDFVHDVFGIRRHIDRRTGKLLDCFVPRFAMPEAAHG